MSGLLPAMSRKALLGGRRLGSEASKGRILLRSACGRESKALWSRVLGAWARGGQHLGPFERRSLALRPAGPGAVLRLRARERRALGTPRPGE